jgi:hypothetical protein
MTISKICELQWKINGRQKGFSDCQQDMWLKIEITCRIIGISNDYQQHAGLRMEMKMKMMDLHGL